MRDIGDNLVMGHLLVSTIKPPGVGWVRFVQKKSGK